MNRVVLIGNGFDLAHGLPTRYVDFINWYWEFCANSLRLCYHKTWSDKLCTFTLKTDATWNCFFFTNVGHFNPPKGHELVSYFRDRPQDFEIQCSPFFDRISKSITEKGWVDIENEYYAILQSMQKDNGYESPKQLNDELDYIKTKLAEYLNSIQGSIKLDLLQNNTLNDMLLEPIYPCEIAVNAKAFLDEFVNRRLDYTETDWKYLWYSWNKTWGACTSSFMMNLRKDYEQQIAKEGIERILEGQIPKNFLLPDRMLLLNFNYTNIADLYLAWDKEQLHRINHIHGDLSDLEGMIFGYGDELDEDYKQISRINDNEYLRYMKSIRYLETENYRQMLSFIESAPYQIYIMGHSCGNSDRTLLNTLFEHRNCVSIKPFYYMAGDGTDNYMDIVQNISRNFTDMKLMRDRVVNKRNCQPLPQQTFQQQ
ncbi:MAG: bacteriophage abortive infection AbiH family protein [Bacteroidales bacterium]|nr:bacteriophage abortive infection AbiH family protein [Bacteroidales bacterium]MCM1146471.1 bacteriophage abortive infection AbiH family protein [Bacteroidales bacterium]MCM1205091.1 bacteriophage abortive infection AbiH family protein [Bacillota bacterium]MCM1509337.1 bacteriophage abortive infection AbiH family protein [Clostridium sp.]